MCLCETSPIPNPSVPAKPSFLAVGPCACRLQGLPEHLLSGCSLQPLCPWCCLCSLFLVFCLNGFGLGKTFPNAHNAPASAQIHQRIPAFPSSISMI